MDPAERSAPPAAAPKENPAGLALRGHPRPVVRFRRGLIIAVATAAAGAIVALAWAALEPVSFLPARDTKAEFAAGPSPEGIAGAPASYADVPKLGRPLPGDLGRAIVGQEHGRGGAGGVEPPGAGSAAAVRQRQSAERIEARESPVLAVLSRPVAASPQRAARPEGSEAGTAPAARRVPGERRAGQESSLPGYGGAHIGLLARSGSPWTLAAGSVIPASLLTGLNSDLPGMVVAQVTHDVHDTATGRTVLIPRGARLIGDYDSKVAFGQQRAFLAWKRLLFPDGSSVDLGAMPATDASGYSGLEDRTDFHEWRLAKGVLLSSVLGVGSELGYGGDDRDLVRALRESAQSNGARAGDSIVSRNLGVQPTLTVRPGWPVRALLHEDLVLEPWRGE